MRNLIHMCRINSRLDKNGHKSAPSRFKIGGHKTGNSQDIANVYFTQVGPSLSRNIPHGIISYGTFN